MKGTSCQVREYTGAPLKLVRNQNMPGTLPQRSAISRVMGKKAKQMPKQAVQPPLDSELETEAAYYARKCGITIDEAAKIIREAKAPTLS